MSVLEWSSAMDALHLEQSVRPVQEDPRTDADAAGNCPLGYPFHVVQAEVIRKGLSDFTTGHSHPAYGDLTPEDKVLLYCFTFFKRHFFESFAHFREHRVELKRLFEPGRRSVFIDLGCGPATAGLALADALSRPRVMYVGLDRASPMLRKAKSLFQAAVSASLLEDTSTIATSTSWSRLRTTLGKFPFAHVLINASYLFASNTLMVDDVTSLVRSLKADARVRNLLLSYTNSAARVAGTKYTAFKKALSGEFASDGLATVTVRYRKRRSGSATQVATYVRELLRFKGE